MSYYVHTVPGRLRIRIPAVKNNPYRALEVEGLVKSIEGIHSTAVNTVTGSIVVNYDARVLNSDNILEFLSKKGFFDPSRVVTNDVVMEQTAFKTGQILGKALVGLAVEKAFQGSALSLLTAFI